MLIWECAHAYLKFARPQRKRAHLQLRFKCENTGSVHMLNECPHTQLKARTCCCVSVRSVHVLTWKCAHAQLKGYTCSTERLSVHMLN